MTKKNCGQIKESRTKYKFTKWSNQQRRSSPSSCSPPPAARPPRAGDELRSIPWQRSRDSSPGVDDDSDDDDGR